MPQIQVALLQHCFLVAHAAFKVTGSHWMHTGTSYQMCSIKKAQCLQRHLRLQTPSSVMRVPMTHRWLWGSWSDTRDVNALMHLFAKFRRCVCRLPTILPLSGMELEQTSLMPLWSNSYLWKSQHLLLNTTWQCIETTHRQECLWVFAVNGDVITNSRVHQLHCYTGWNERRDYPNLQRNAQDEKWFQNVLSSLTNDTGTTSMTSLIHQFPGDVHHLAGHWLHNQWREGSSLSNSSF